MRRVPNLPQFAKFWNWCAPWLWGLQLKGWVGSLLRFAVTVRSKSHSWSHVTVLTCFCAPTWEVHRRCMSPIGRNVGVSDFEATQLTEEQFYGACSHSFYLSSGADHFPVCCSLPPGTEPWHSFLPPFSGHSGGHRQVGLLWSANFKTSRITFPLKTYVPSTGLTLLMLTCSVQPYQLTVGNVFPWNTVIVPN